MSRQKKEEEKYKDFINFQPELVKFITLEQSKIIGKFYVIVKALRQKNMTVKEIHNLYLNPDTKKHTYTIKTVYRHLEKLTEAGIVVVSGHRETIGSRQVEKLYSRSANIFFTEKSDEYINKKLEYGKEIAKNLHVVFGELLQKPNVDLDELTPIVLNYMKNAHKNSNDTIKSIPENKVLAELFSKTEIDLINDLSIYIGIFLTYIKNPELFEKLKELYS